VWIGGAGGACRYDDRAKNFLPVPNLGPVRRLRSAPDGVLWAIASETVTAVQPDLTVKPYLRTRRPLDLSPDGEIVWVGTVRGIEVLQPRTGEVADVLRTADKFVKIPAIAADGRGGVWAATDAGNVLHLATSGRDLGATLFDLDPYEPPNVLEILPEGHWGAWALTDQGPWALTRPR
jgi:ligand-binding sensor domain-containing protein